MTTLVEAVRNIKAPRPYFLAAFGGLLLLAAVALYNLGQFRRTEWSKPMPQQTALDNEVAGRAYSPASLRSSPSAIVQKGCGNRGSAVRRTDTPALTRGREDRPHTFHHAGSATSRKASRIKSRHSPRELGGYLVNADGGGQNAQLPQPSPVACRWRDFEEARAEIRKLGLRVESEKIDAQDVSRQYVDQDANLRNLRAEEAGYLAILKQAQRVNSTCLRWRKAQRGARTN